MITIGLDPHPGSHTVAALDDQSATLATLTVKNLPEGLADLRIFAERFTDHRWAIEGAANRYILPFVMSLLEQGHVVHHIPQT